MFDKLMETINNLRNDPTPEQLEEAVQRLIKLESDIGNLTVIFKNYKEDMEETISQKNQEIIKRDKKISSLINAISKENDEICQALGKALHYPWFKDDQENFPGANEETGVCVGEHVAVSIAEEAAKWIERAWPLVRSSSPAVEERAWDK